jgi:AcrR family transcriptional regulator
MALRQEKKERTREAIADTAWALFADRGFDAITVAEVARAAHVSEATVFNYFRTKEDLFFFRLEAYGEHLVAAVAERPARESVLDTVRRVLLQPGGLLAQVDAGDQQARDRLRTLHRVINESPALRARETISLARAADLLAAQLLAESGRPNDLGVRVDAQVVAHALLAIQLALVQVVRDIVLAGEVPPNFSAQLAKIGADAFTLLADGLEQYGSQRAQTGAST